MIQSLMLTNPYHDSLISAIVDHAIEEFPKESCGIVVDNEYIKCVNVADDPLTNFVIPAKMYHHYYINNCLQAIVHSHPNEAEPKPSLIDMSQQVSLNVPWILVGIHEDKTPSGVIWWGDDLPISPLIGRPFIYGVYDCYSLLRDWYRENRNILLPPYPRKYEWWTTDKLEDNMFLQYYSEAGFVHINTSDELKIGDAILFSIRGKLANHCGVYIGRGLFLHHLPGRVSKPEPLNMWMKYVNSRYRHYG